MIDVARRGLVPVCFATALLHLAAVCLAATYADCHPEWLRTFRLSFRQGRSSVALAASVASPKRETTAPIRVVRSSPPLPSPPSPKPEDPSETVRRREPETPAPPAASFAVAAVGRQLPLPPFESRRSEAPNQEADESQPAAIPPRQAAQAMPRETAAAMESAARAGSTASSGATTLEPPTKLVQIKPSYPPLSQARGEEGVVKIRIRIDRNGQVVDADVYQSSGFPLLDASALETAWRWRFPPVGNGGAKFATEWVEPVRFLIPANRE